MCNSFSLFSSLWLPYQHLSTLNECVMTHSMSLQWCSHTSKVLGTALEGREQMFLLNRRVTWWSIQSPCGKRKRRNPMIIFLFSTNTETGCLCVREGELVKALALHGQSHLTAHLSLNSTPSSLAAPPPPPPTRANDDVTQLTALYGLIIFRYYCYYLPNQWLSSAGLIATAVHQA